MSISGNELKGIVDITTGFSPDKGLWEQGFVPPDKGTFLLLAIKLLKEERFIVPKDLLTLDNGTMGCSHSSRSRILLPVLFIPFTLKGFLVTAGSSGNLI